MKNSLSHKWYKQARSGNALFNLLCVLWLLASSPAVIARRQPYLQIPPEQRIKYQIALTLDFDNRTFSGVERVRWVNRGDHATSTLFFHLYANMRTPDYVPPTIRNDAGQLVS